MSKKNTLRKPDGPWALVLNLLRSPLASCLMVITLAIAVLLGYGTPIGGHPGEGILVRLPFALLPLLLLARLEAKGVRRWGTIALSGGIVLILVGTWPAGGRSGHLKIDSRIVESFDQVITGRTVPTHIGGQLAGTVTEGELVLELGTGGQIQERSRVSLGDRQEAALGPYLIRSEGEIPNPTVDTAVITLTPRDGQGAAVTVKAPLGRAISLGESAQVTTQNIRGDYLGVVGSAAQLDLVWKDGQEVAWHFVDEPSLDARAGLSPWRVRLDRLESSTVHSLGLRRAGADPVAWMGIALLFIGLLARTRRSEETS